MGKVKGNPNRFADAYINIGVKIGYYRRLRGYTQYQLSEMADMSQGYLSQIEAPGLAVAISLEKLLTIAEVLQIPASKLLEFEEL